MKTKDIFITAIWYALVIVGIFLVFCTPAEDSATWIEDFFVSKGIGFLFLFGAWRLQKES